jgi:N6-adenosine-specific RNA methylase IME4/ribosomal protein L12E/L44/L45/RPP1/RPP2
MEGAQKGRDAMSGELIRYEAARSALIEARRVDEAKDIRDKAVALQAYARQANDTALLDHATDIRLRAERRAGEILMRMAEDGERFAQGGDREAKSQEGILRLSDLGVTPKQSSMWQTLARVDETSFEEIVASRKSDAHRATQGSRAERAQAKKERRAEREKDLAEKIRALPDKRYGVIYADPEWRFEVRSEKGLDRAADNHYTTSALSDICARDVGSIAADDCVLFMWVTSPMLGVFPIVLENWGFEYKSCIVWAKDKAGTGYWTRDKAEHLVIATRGAPPCPAPGEQFESLIAAPVGAHSAKPDIFAEIIEAMFPNIPKIELNRRGAPRDGWDAWGNEAEDEAEDE